MGFDAKVNRGVYATREIARVAAEEKTIRNVTAAIERALKVFDKAAEKMLKKDLKEAKARLKVRKDALAKA